MFIMVLVPLSLLLRLATCRGCSFPERWSWNRKPRELVTYWVVCFNVEINIRDIWARIVRIWYCMIWCRFPWKENGCPGLRRLIYIYIYIHAHVLCVYMYVCMCVYILPQTVCRLPQWDHGAWGWSDSIWYDTRLIFIRYSVAVC